MKHLRTILWVGLALILLVNYQTWVMEFSQQDAAAAAAAEKAAALEKANNPLTADVPQAAAAPVAGSTPAASAGDVPVAATAAPVAETTALAPAPVLNVRTDVLDVDVSTRGGVLTRADLLQYPIVKGKPEPVQLLRDKGAGNQYLLETGLTASGTTAVTDAPTHLVDYTSDFRGFRLESGIDELSVPLKWTAPNGVQVTKTLTFRRGSYRVDVKYEVNNPTELPWSASPYAKIVHDRPAVERSYFNVDSYSFTGPALYDGKKYEKLKITDKDDAALNRDVSRGWLASLEHHFAVAVIPPLDQTHNFKLTVRGDEYIATDLGKNPVVVAPGSMASIEQTLFVGPKLQTQLKDIHPELGRAADFGFMTFLSRPLFWLLEFAHKIFNNWGMAIIAATFVLKLVFYPLSEASGRSMAKMKLVAPKMKQLQETYKDDRTKLGQAMMELYKKEKINPASGCLPMLIQLPVFLSFYWVLLEAVEMRQAPFFGWLQDLSSKDPFFILPIIMAGAMFLQYKLQPTPADPIQAKVFMILPLVMSVTFAFFPAGLVLYWVTNTILTIVQQWNINRRIEASSGARA
jgi:YidC/Oxa1 family membrane protein insertase